MKFGVARTSAVTACAVLALSISAHHAIALTASDDLPTDEVLIGAEVEGQELEEDLPIPGEPEDQVVPEPDLSEKEPNNSTLGLQCKPGWFFKITQNKKNTMSVKYKTFVENASNKPIEVFSAK